MHSSRGPYWLTEREIYNMIPVFMIFSRKNAQKNARAYARKMMPTNWRSVDADDERYYEQEDGESDA